MESTYLPSFTLHCTCPTIGELPLEKLHLLLGSWVRDDIVGMVNNCTSMVVGLDLCSTQWGITLQQLRGLWTSGGRGRAHIRSPYYWSKHLMPSLLLGRRPVRQLVVRLVTIRLSDFNCENRQIRFSTIWLLSLANMHRWKLLTRPSFHTIQNCCFYHCTGVIPFVDTNSILLNVLRWCRKINL